MLQSEYDLRVRRQESFILAQDGQFLGTLSSNIYQSDSIMNEYGIYGSKYSATSILINMVVMAVRMARIVRSILIQEPRPKLY